MDGDIASVSSAVSPRPESNQKCLPPEGIMRDIEISNHPVTLDGPLASLKPWFDLTQVEFARRCKASLISYMCFDFACLRLLEVLCASLHSLFDNVVKKFNMPVWPTEETIDVSTSVASTNENTHGDGSNGSTTLTLNDTVTSSSNVHNNNGNNDLSNIPVSGTMSTNHDTSQNFGLGVLEGYCDVNHPVYLTLRRMWNEPDLYAPFWINVMMAGALFKMYALNQYHNGTDGGFLSLSTLCFFLAICWSCSLLMAAAIWGCRTIICGIESRVSVVPLLSVAGYMQIPLLMFCKLTVWISIIRLCIPSLSVVIRGLQYVTYVYFCASTSSTVALFIPPAPEANKDTRLKIATAVVTCAIQLYYFYWFEFYI
ncbi:uncharacterized protein BXIN_1471 [Babesia sp. Xinjiang]|uniref:uncharacterized protein n=1 Tax=Babesia sp. Xinjiang TaxID=462227 RepID=UPI000A217CD8|nr:uncharacterized protein BXIN_1471 [Babesia sp. Xinjiang]ORM40013.1 hypothetical protein BXIN_1471 [Babesia sp. Xinjiang]